MILSSILIVLVQSKQRAWGRTAAGNNTWPVHKNGVEIYIIKWQIIKICRNQKRSKPVKAQSVMYRRLLLSVLLILIFTPHINFPNIAGEKHSISTIAPTFSILEKSYKTNLSFISQQSVI